jgi:hypothetical protein
LEVSHRFPDRFFSTHLLFARLSLKTFKSTELSFVEPDPMAPPTTLKLYVRGQERFSKALEPISASRTIKSPLLEGHRILEKLLVEGVQTFALFRLNGKKLPLITPDPAAVLALIQDDEPARMGPRGDLLHLDIAMGAARHRFLL